MVDRRVDEVLKKYGGQIEKAISSQESSQYSKEYLQFKREIAPTLSLYERLARGVGKTDSTRFHWPDDSSTCTRDPQCPGKH